MHFAPKYIDLFEILLLKFLQVLVVGNFDAANWGANETTS
jgi:hypothetical protein